MTYLPPPPLLPVRPLAAPGVYFQCVMVKVSYIAKSVRQTDDTRLVPLSPRKGFLRRQEGSADRRHASSSIVTAKRVPTLPRGFGRHTTCGHDGQKKKRHSGTGRATKHKSPPPEASHHTEGRQPHAREINASLGRIHSSDARDAAAKSPGKKTAQDGRPHPRTELASKEDKMVEQCMDACDRPYLAAALS